MLTRVLGHYARVTRLAVPRAITVSRNTLKSIPMIFRTDVSERTRWASSVTPTSSTHDPAEMEALEALEAGTQKLEEGDVEGARALYQRSVDLKPNASNLFNLGVTKYHAKDFDGAIENWKQSIELQPDSPDAHTNLASAYIMNPVPKPQLAVQHLSLIIGNLTQGPVGGELDESLKYYTISKDNGVERAAVHVRNVYASPVPILTQLTLPSASEEAGKSSGGS
ncbi:TPR_2 domain-containing protein [Rhizoctonia solani AG-1 IA]|uniref:TPR_2 domain-containing protein n=1 Tax=Thanatephorus cucumeris (strain AG1-IA) TaxID=983506 RepID=L8X085_THACA|nr:TPR_2 domain-containing protein [Rhizoctonia solani AG-1 IA]